MKVSISVNGRFHAFQLAKALQEHNSLNKLITTYPTSHAIRYGVKKEHVQSLLIYEVLKRGWKKLPSPFKKIDMSAFFCALFDNHVSRLITSDNDIVVAWSGSAIKILRKAKAAGSIAIVERGSAHIDTQVALVNQEYEKFGAVKGKTHPAIIEREHQEYEEADYISIPSTFVKQTFIEQGISADKLIQTPYGVDTNLFQPKPKQDKVFRVIFCGSAALHKGLHYLLQAFYELDLPNSELWVVGHVADNMRSFASKYRSDKIIYKGSQLESDLPDFYAQGSVFCLPSIAEGLALVILQAMSCGLPILCTPNCGTEGIVTPNEEGLFIPPRQVKTIKEQLTFLYENQEIAKKMGKQARQTIENNFTWQHYGEKMIRVYQKILTARVNNGNSCST